MSADKNPAKRPIGLRIVLFALLGLALGALYVDRRARSASEAANDRLSEMDSGGGTVDWATVNGLLEREPTSSSDAASGVIEHYEFAGGLPGRKYTLRIGYAKQLDGQLTYVAHNLNDPEGDTELTQLIAAQGQRVSRPSDESEAFGDSDAGGGGGGGGEGGGRGRGGFGGGDLIADNDTDGDGKLSKEEAPERMQSFFDRVDANTDGFLEQSELDAMRSRFGGGGGGGQGGGRGGFGGGREDNRPERPERPELEE